MKPGITEEQIPSKLLPAKILAEPENTPDLVEQTRIFVRTLGKHMRSEQDRKIDKAFIDSLYERD